MPASSTIAVYSKKFDKYFGGNGWVDRLPGFLITRYDTHKDAQATCDAMRLANADFDREKARLPEYEVCHVVDLITKEIFVPPEFTKNKYVLERQWPEGVSSLTKTS